MDSEKMRLHAIVEGHVQGVNFRAFVVQQASALGVTGWVRNRWDGSVEVVGEGERARLDQLLAALQRGPRSAYVSGVMPEWQPASGEFTGFRMRYNGL